MKQQNYMVIFIILLYCLVLRKMQFDLSQGSDLLTLFLCIFLVVRSIIQIIRDKEDQDKQE